MSLSRFATSSRTLGWSGAGRLVTFFALVVVALVVVNVLIDSGLHHVGTAEFGVFNRIVNGTINATVLITGSSRALNHYDPREIRKRTGVSAWNIGINGSQTDMQLAVLQTYLHHNSRPALLIHNLDSFAFVTSKSGVTFPESYVPYLGEPPIYQALRRVDASWWKARYLPLYGYAVEDMRFTWVTGVAALLGRSPTEVRFNGFEPRETQWTEDFDRFKQANPDGVSFPIDPDGVDALEQLVAEVSTRGGHVLLVYSPVYYEMQELDRGRPELFAKFRQIAERYHADLWDYSDSPISRRRDLFYNSQHLNAEGAALFSAALAERLAGSSLLRGRSRPVTASN